MASALAPYLVTSSVSTSSLSHHPSPAPSLSPPPTSPTPSTSSEVPRKRKRDEFLATPVSPNVSSPSRSLIRSNVSAPNNMYTIRILSGIWETLKNIIGVGASTVEPTRETDEAPESPQKRVRVDSSFEEEGSTSDDQPNKEESIASTTQSAPTQVSNKEAPRLQTNNNRTALKIKAPTSIGRQTPPTQQLPSPLASSSEDEGENIFKKTTTVKPTNSAPAKMAPIIPSITSGPLEQNELPFFAEPLQRKRGARTMLQRALARREAHDHRESGYPPIGTRFPLHLQRKEVYKSMSRTPLRVSRISQELGFTPAKIRSPQDIWAAMSMPASCRKNDELALSAQWRAMRLKSHTTRVQKKVRESYAQSQQRSQAENESLEALLRQLIADKAQGFHSYEEVARRRQERAEDVKRMREADTKVEVIPPLTPEQAKLVKETIAEVQRDARIGRNKTYIQKFKIPVGTQDLSRVPSGNWLNDEVINFYFHMIVDRSKNDHPGEPQKVLAHNTFFFEKLTQSGYKSVARWASRQGVGGKALLDLDFLFVPVHVGASHWCLAVVNFKMKRFEYYDSLGGNFQPQNKPLYFKKMREYVEAETGTSFAEWTNYVMPGAPQQSNHNDCGAFTIKTAEVLARGGKISFRAEDMPLIRNRILLEVLGGALLPSVVED